MHRRLTNGIYGAIGGATAAACMTVIRAIAHRWNAIDKSVPQATEEWVAHRTGIGGFRQSPVHHVADQLMHLAYGSALGAAYGLTSRLGWGRESGKQSAPRLLLRGGAFGLATWVFGSWALLPLLRAKKGPWRQGMVENGIDLSAHLAYGLVTALVSGDLSAQRDHRASPDARRFLARVG